MNKIKVYLRNGSTIILSVKNCKVQFPDDKVMFAAFYDDQDDVIAVFNWDEIIGWAVISEADVKKAEEMERKIEEFKERFTGEVIPDRVAEMVINKLEGDQ